MYLITFPFREIYTCSIGVVRDNYKLLTNQFVVRKRFLFFNIIKNSLSFFTIKR